MDEEFNIEDEPVQERKSGFKRTSSKKRKSYDLNFMKHAFELFDKSKNEGVKNMQHSVAAQLGVPQGTFAGWLKLRDVYEAKMANASEAQMKQMQGKGNCHAPFYPEEEERLREILLERRANDLPCSGDFIRGMMNQLVRESHERNPDSKVKSFNASHNWLTRFSRRINMPNRKGPIPGTTSRKVPKSERPIDPNLLVPSGRRKRKPESDTATAVRPVRSVVPKQAAPVHLKTVQQYIDEELARDDSSDDDVDNLGPLHNIELLLQQQPVSDYTSSTNIGSAGLYESGAGLYEGHAYDHNLNVDVPPKKRGRPKTGPSAGGPQI